MSLAVTWYDNAAFRLGGSDKVLWFDPSINKNPDSPIKTTDLKDKADFVLTTHGDPGHFVNSVEVAQRTGALFLAPEELCQYVLDQKQMEKERLIPLRFGENRIADGLQVFVFEAEHPEQSEETMKMMAQWGRLITKNVGFVVQIGKATICHLGDVVYTDVFEEIGRRFSIDIGMLPIQGKKKASPVDEAVESAARIIRVLKPSLTFPVIQYTKQMNRVELLKKRLAELKIEAPIIFDKPGREHLIR